MNGEGNHKGCPYREGWCGRTVVRAGAERGALGVGVGWAPVGAVIDALGAVKGEGNHKGCPYREGWCERTVVRAGAERGALGVGVDGGR